MLSARFDLDALRPPAPLPAGQARHPAQAHTGWPALRRWCLEGAGPGTRPLWSPGSVPAIERLFSVAALDGADGRASSALAHALCLERDGSLQLQACPTAWGRLQLRAVTKLHDAMWWRARLPTDAWDSGYVIPTPAGLQALARFTPRRPTLVVAEGLAPDGLRRAVEALQARQSQFAQPLRLLLVDAGKLPAMLPVAPAMVIMRVNAR